MSKIKSKVTITLSKDIEICKLPGENIYDVVERIKTIIKNTYKQDLYALTIFSIEIDGIKYYKDEDDVNAND